MSNVVSLDEYRLRKSAAPARVSTEPHALQEVEVLEMLAKLSDFIQAEMHHVDPLKVLVAFNILGNGILTQYSQKFGDYQANILAMNASHLSQRYGHLSTGR